MTALNLKTNFIAYIESVLLVSVVLGMMLMLRNQLFLHESNPSGTTQIDTSFGWKFPVSQFGTSGRVTDIGAYSSLRDPGGVPRGLPVRLKIPSINVDTAIEDAKITPDGRMDVPEGSVNVAWFALGPRPGQIGSAVIGGHFGIKDGVPFVFYDLDKLKSGDRVYVVDDNDNTLTFEVRTIRLFDRDADATSVFLSNDGLSHLNVITCEGIWNMVDDSYPDRRVVFTDMITSEEEPVLQPEVSTPIPVKINEIQTPQPVSGLATRLFNRTNASILGFIIILVLLAMFKNKKKIYRKRK